MIKLVKTDKDSVPTKSMEDMKPLEVGVVAEGAYQEIVVMRTASSERFEVMDLSNPREDGCWEDKYNIRIRELTEEEKESFTLKLT